jgi:hypothetical protein
VTLAGSPDTAGPTEAEAVALVLATFPGAVPLDAEPDQVELVELQALGPAPSSVRRSSTGLGTCSRCGDRLTTAAAVEVRCEYRALSDLSRLRTWRERLVCRACAFDEAERHDHPRGRQGEQETLL